MSKKKKNSNSKENGWQKIETKPQTPSNDTGELADTVKEEASPASEAEAKEDTSSESSSVEVDSVKEEKDVASAQNEIEPKEETKPQPSTAEKPVKKHKKRHSFAAPLGFLFVALALVGFINLIFFGVHSAERLIDNSSKKEEFSDFILPVLMFDPIPFENPAELGDLALLRSSIWAAILDGTQKYTVSDSNMVSVPQSDVDVACAKLFGPDLQLKHQSFEDYISVYSLDEATKSYLVPVDASIMYTPRVEDISRSGDLYDLTVAYLAPDNQWMQSITGKKTEPDPSKYMIYQLQKVDGKYRLVAIKDPPEGAVPGIPKISENPPQNIPQQMIQEIPVPQPIEEEKDEDTEKEEPAKEEPEKEETEEETEPTKQEKTAELVKNQL